MAFHYLAGKSEEEESLDDDLMDLSDLERDSNGFINFTKFLKIFEVCSRYGKSNFGAKKAKYIAERRKALKAGNESEYETIVMTMTEQEEGLVNSKLMDIISKLGISE